MDRAGLVARLAAGCRVSVLTGAGISAESGVPTFRGHGGLWASVPIEEVATPEAFATDPVKVWRFYDGRRREAAAVTPNPAHVALARLGELEPSLTVVTQNIDNLHQDAGSRGVVELHGNLWRLRCTVPGCGTGWEDRMVPLPDLPPRCPECGGIARPDIVWFHEPLPMEAVSAAQASCSCDLFLVIGTSATVYPAAAFPQIAKAQGALLVELNVEETPLTPRTDLFLKGRAGETLPELVTDLEAARGR